MRETAFGVSVPETQEEHYARIKREERERAVQLAAFRGNRARRRHPFAGMRRDRAPLTPREVAKRKVRNRMARESRRVNR